jgi:hypothetical protein
MYLLFSLSTPKLCDGGCGGLLREQGCRSKAWAGVGGEERGGHTAPVIQPQTPPCSQCCSAFSKKLFPISSCTSGGVVVLTGQYELSHCRAETGEEGVERLL